MAECTVARCSQERRLFRRELQKWNKEILYVIGLERLAEELMGAHKWKTLVQPFSDLESKYSNDWCPEEICCFCNAKKLPPYDPASGIIPIVDGYNSLRIDTDDHSTSSDQGTAPGSYTSCSSALSPWYVSALSSHQLSGSPTIIDQPLDLSISSMRQTTEEFKSQNEVTFQNSLDGQDATDLSINSVLKVPQIPSKPGLRKRVDINSKRSYTEEELQAALRDIQSGKLGTRRAAVIYGIPRSTLRNKVYKLANESKSRAHCRVIQSTVKGKIQSKSSKHSVEPALPTESSIVKHKNVVSASESLRQLLKHTITQKALGVAKSTDAKYNATESQNCVTESEDVEAFQMFGTLEYSPALVPVLSHVFANIQQLALGKCTENFSSNKSLSALKDELKLPILPDLIRRLAEERMEIEKDRLKACSAIDMDVDSDKIDSLEPLPNVILKVPSFTPTNSSPLSGESPETNLPVISSPDSPSTSSSHILSGNKGIAVSLKELITRSISQKPTHLSNSSSIEELNFKFPPTSSSDLRKLADSTSWNPQDSYDQDKGIHMSPSTLSTLSSSESTKSEKRTRPKRGRYRNYDRDNLARAVRAVQKGEMSVHRAGTFYGVPHSTLEYKVKERHLLRPRKRDIFGSSSTAETSETITESSSQFDVVPDNRKDLSTFSHFNEIPNGFKTDIEENHRPLMGSFPSHFSLWQSMPFFSLDFPQLGSNNFFASQMMRKLQENARLHEETQKNRKSQDLGLLESLIKSTLDRPTSPENKTSLPFASNQVPALSDTKSRETALGK